MDAPHEHADADVLAHLHGSLLAFRCADGEAPAQVGVAAVHDGGHAALEGCDLCLVMGSSGVVQSAASVPFVALGAGVPVVEVSPDLPELTAAVTHHLQGTAGTVLPALLG